MAVSLFLPDYLPAVRIAPLWDKNNNTEVFYCLKCLYIACAYIHEHNIYIFFFADLLSCVSEAIQIDLPFYEELILLVLSSPYPHHKARYGGVQEVWQHAKVQAPPSWILQKLGNMIKVTVIKKKKD